MLNNNKPQKAKVGTPTKASQLYGSIKIPVKISTQPNSTQITEKTGVDCLFTKVTKAKIADNRPQKAIPNLIKTATVKTTSLIFI